MNWIENLLIIAGVSLDVFAAMECQGSLVKKVNKKQLSYVCIGAVLFQLVAFGIGYLLTYFIYKLNPISNDALLGEILSALIFFCMGIRLIVKAIKDDIVVEHLQHDFSAKRLIRMAGVTSLYTLVAGIAFGLVGTELTIALVLIVAITVLFVIGGTYTGYHFGFEQKRKAYIAGAILLWLAGADIIVRQILHLF